MKRFRVKIVGLGLALAAGTAVAADADWHAPGEPAPVVVPAGGPGLLPPALRARPKAESPIWVSAGPTATQTTGPVAAAPIVTPASGVTAPDFVPPIPVPPPPPPAVTVSPPPAPQPEVQPTPSPATGTGLTAGPRGKDAFGPLPAIPVVPEVRESPVSLPAIPEAPAAPPAGASPAPPAPLPIPQPKPAEPPMMLPPHAPEYLPPRKSQPAPMPEPVPPGPVPGPLASPLPAPRPVETQPQPADAQPELQPAPAELMIPTGAMAVGGKHTLFGSPPVRISRDYPPLRDLVQQGHNHGDLTLLDDGTTGTFNRFFVRGEYLLWWMPGFATPVLATTNPNTALNGFLGEPGTTALIGPGGFVGSTRSGFRVRAGAWLDDCGSCGIDGSFFFLGNRSASAMVNSNQDPIITRPVFVPNLVPGTNAPLGENGESVTVPGVLQGGLAAQGSSSLWGADVNLRKCLLNRCDVRAELFAGYRFLNLRESLAITENILVVGPGNSQVAVMDPIGTHVVVQDRFATRNYFNGGQIGGLYERRFGRWSWDARGSIALGDTHQVLEIDGYQVRQRPGAAPMTFRGGLLAAGPNIGRFTSDHFSVVPEFSLNIGYFVTPNFRIYAGYNFLLWTNVIRPGDQIDRTVDLTFVPNSPAAGFSGLYRPRPLFKQSDLVLNGIQFGLDWRW